MQSPNHFEFINAMIRKKEPEPDGLPQVTEPNYPQNKSKFEVYGEEMIKRL